MNIQSLWAWSTACWSQRILRLQVKCKLFSNFLIEIAWSHEQFTKITSSSFPTNYWLSHIKFYSVMHGGPVKWSLCFKTDLSIWIRKILSHFESHFQRLIHQFALWKSHVQKRSCYWHYCNCLISTSLYLQRQAQEFSSCWVKPLDITLSGKTPSTYK